MAKPHWFRDSMTLAQQREYLKSHPNSKMRLSGTNTKPSRKRSMLGRMIARHFHPDNVLHRKIVNDPIYRKAKRAARIAEGDLANAKHIKVSPEKLEAIRLAFKHAQEAQDRALTAASKKHKKHNGE